MSLSQEKDKIFIGIDLSAKENKPSPICIFFSLSRTFNFFTIHKNEEIINIINSLYGLKKRTKIYVLFDSPLFSESGVKFRSMDLIALKLGGKLLPLSFKSIKELGQRGELLSHQLLSKYKELVIFETHPYTASKILGYSNTKQLSEKLLGTSLNKGLSDAFACCISGIIFFKIGGIAIEDDYSHFTMIFPKNISSS
ncbi:hypothetical protein IOK49_05000 [Fervidicoccus fontis]|uniref:DUF429 domain-containing protein n=1 Tax=Fervidicoccus fontis TaxID=683846 RepID=A0A843AIL1_9CREN|nr:hypothetical protein [Fervidicoccus fontis]MBE9391429.1 hypothetical protein [Fervidicoccus fontis]